MLTAEWKHLSNKNKNTFLCVASWWSAVMCRLTHDKHWPLWPCYSELSLVQVNNRQYGVWKLVQRLGQKLGSNCQTRQFLSNKNQDCYFFLSSYHTTHCQAGYQNKNTQIKIWKIQTGSITPSITITSSALLWGQLFIGLFFIFVCRNISILNPNKLKNKI